MKLDCVLTAVNENPLYLEFIPLFVNTWNKLYPNVDVKIILIANKIPEKYNKYQENIILFEPLEGVSTAFISQYIRLLYPAILKYENGVMITDVDIIPMNRTYYTNNIESFTNDKFIYLRDVLFEYKELAMCYNIAAPQIWSDIFNIKTLEDIKYRLNEKFKTIEYVDGHGKSGWSVDQKDLYNYVINWNKTTNNFICLKDRDTRFNRLNRCSFDLNSYDIFNNVKTGHYSDYHCYRPFSQYENLNNKIYNFL